MRVSSDSSGSNEERRGVALFSGRFPSLFLLNLLYDVCLLTTLFWVFTQSVVLYQLTSGEAWRVGGPELAQAYTDWTEAQAAYPEETDSDYAAQVAALADAYARARRSAVESQIAWLLLGNIPHLALAGWGRVGMLYPMNAWRRKAETESTVRAWWTGMRKRWKSGVLLGLMDGVVGFAAYAGYVFYGQWGQNGGSALWRLPQMMMIVGALVWSVIRWTAYPLAADDGLSFFSLVRMSAKRATARPLRTVALALATTVVPLILLGVAPEIIRSAFVWYMLFMGFAVNALLQVQQLGS